MVVGAARPTLHYREPAGCWRQYRHRPSCVRPRTAIRFFWSIRRTRSTRLYDKLNFNFIRDIAPIAGIDREPNVLEVNPWFPVKTVPEFVAYAKAIPGKINMASGGNGTTNHVAGEMFKMMAGINMTVRSDSPHLRRMTTLESLMIHMIQEPSGQTLSNEKEKNRGCRPPTDKNVQDKGQQRCSRQLRPE
jgi:hypothetical protein